MSLCFLSLPEHKVVFLEGGNSPCSGKVGIEHGSKTYWLSGSNKTWNHETANTVCRQTLCGEPSDFTSIPSSGMMKDVWNESYTCSPKTKSLFKCEKATLPSDYNATIATVKCSGNMWCFTFIHHYHSCHWLACGSGLRDDALLHLCCKISCISLQLV